MTKTRRAKKKQRRQQARLRAVGPEHVAMMKEARKIREARARKVEEGLAPLREASANWVERPATWSRSTRYREAPNAWIISGGRVESKRQKY